MSYRVEKNNEDRDIVVEGWELGIAQSPHKGLANIQNANIATEEGEIMCSFGRFQQTMTNVAATVGTLTFQDSTHVNLSIPGANNKIKGMWITVSNSSNTGELNNGNYWVTLSLASTGFQLSTSYNGSVISGYTTGLTADIVLIRNLGTPIAWTKEVYFDASSNVFYRYYLLDSQGLVWVYDSINDLFPNDDQQYWFLPDTSITYFGSDTTPSGLAVMNGWLHVFSGNKIWVKQTVKLGSGYTQMTNAILMSRANSKNPHFAYVGHQGKMYWTDGNYIGSIFPNTSINTGAQNVQSFASYTTATTTGTISALISGSIPSTGWNVGSDGFKRIPAVFFAATGGTPAASLSANTVYYIQYSTALGTFEVYDAATGGSAKDITTGATGTQYFNTYYPVGTQAGAYGTVPLMDFSPQRLNLPTYEIAKCMTEIGNTIIIGAISNVLYPWNQVDVLPSNLIFLPENNTQQLLTVNQMAYVFAGNKANIYITDGSVASLVLKVPDYCAGIDGTVNSYFEPVFTWGGVMYLRGRVYFSILDQTSTKAGNCGGIWSFYPTQNLSYGQQTGLALRLENQNSYGTYSGVATVLIPYDLQTLKSPRYWAAWYSSITSATNGIDYTNTMPVGSTVIETDIIPIGTMLNKTTYKQIEFKMATNLSSGETVTIKWRGNTTDAYASMGTAIQEGNTAISGYFVPNFQGLQWLQLEITLSPSGDPAGSLLRLNQVRIR